jgi:hypothetical protein
MKTETLNKKIKRQKTFIDSMVKLKISKHFTKKKAKQKLKIKRKMNKFETKTK